MTDAVQDVEISVVIPAYNAEAFIDRAIESVLNQTRPVQEVIVVNDGSTDGTEQHLTKYKGAISVISQRNRGASTARNFGILSASKPYIAFLDADDFWAPSKIEEQIEVISHNPGAGFVSCEAQILDDIGEANYIWKFEAPKEKLLNHLFTRHAGIPGSLSAVVVRKEALARAGLFDTVLTSQEDVDLWIRLAAVTEFACSHSIGVSITRQEGSVSSNYRSMLDCAKYVMRKNRNLLSAKDRGGFWRAAMSGMLTDYAKWAYRQEGRLEAISLLVESGLQSTKHWRLIASLLVAFVRSEEV